jgi:hypothetical protein
MADKATSIKAKLTEMATKKIPHFIRTQSQEYSFCYLYDYSDDDFARLLVPFRDVSRMPKNSEMVPIGIVEVLIHYSDITAITTPTIQVDLLTRLKDELPEAYNRVQSGNITYGVDHDMMLDKAGLNLTKDKLRTNNEEEHSGMGSALKGDSGAMNPLPNQEPSPLSQ